MVTYHRPHPSKTIPIRRASAEFAYVYTDDLPTDHWRPRLRCECVDGLRPCPFVGCRHNLFLDVNRSSGSIKLNFPGREIDELKDTCALDIADRGEHTLDEVGHAMNLTRERIRQIETGALEQFPTSIGQYLTDDKAVG